MKLATLKDGTRDGTLLVVSKDLKRAQKADHIAPTLRSALDDWNYVQPLLVELSLDLEPNRSNRAFDLDPRQLMAPSTKRRASRGSPAMSFARASSSSIFCQSAS